ncbi:hypothetical protein Bca52824_016254 [Brassica carinata]|uniref:Uncharacterized protein n=1 Tax=Brassica carinata TaxID=52824 RepID=A0A8X7W450_BRACI|nr:hypothetical protein Bca52824_016254 [Brassica carinata]
MFITKERKLWRRRSSFKDEFFSADTIVIGLENVHQLVVIEEGPEIHMQCALELENSIDTKIALEVVIWSVVF